MNALKELISIESLETRIKEPYGFFMINKSCDSYEADITKISIDIVCIKEPTKTFNDECSVYDGLESIFNDLTLEKVAHEVDVYKIQEAKIKIARLTSRGFAQNFYKNFMFYHVDTTKVDRICSIIKHDGNYLLFMNPHAINYIEKFDTYIDLELL